MKYLVETISIFRMRYVIEANEESHALDEVVMNEGDLHEFSQHHLDEIISSSREIDDAEYLRLFNKDNDYLKDWPDDRKFNAVNVVVYEN